MVFIAAIATSSAFLVSTKGITAILAVFCLFLIHRRWKELILFGGVASIACLPWLIWQRSIAAPADPVLQYYSKASYGAGHIFGNCSLEHAFEVFGTNITWIAQGFADLIGIDSTQGSLVSILASGLAILAATGFWMSIRTRITAADLWFTIHIGMLLCWIWPPSRYLLPIFPLFLGYVGLAASILINRCPKILKPKLVAFSLTILCMFLAGLTSFRAAKTTWEKKTMALAANYGLEDWQAIKDSCAWIRQNTDPQDVIAANLDPLVYLMTGRKAVRGFVADPYLLFYTSDQNRKPLGDIIAFRNHLIRNKITYLMITPMYGYAEAPYFVSLLGQLIKHYPGSVQLAKTWKEPTAHIWEIDRARLIR